MKSIFTMAILALLLQSSAVAQQHRGDYVVYVLSVNGSVPMSTFSGLSGVYGKGTYDGVTTYYISGFDSEQAAQDAKNNAIAKGFVTARVETTQELRELASKCCMAAPIDDFKIRNIFFDFDRAYLRPAGKVELDKLVSILKSNPSYTAEFHAHTDSKGSLEYNIDLSKRRRDAAQNYVTARGIGADRIQTFIYGEDRPIAKNDVAGADTPEGRQLNRRVEIRVKDGTSDAGKVEEIAVPDQLKN